MMKRLLSLLVVVCLFALLGVGASAASPVAPFYAVCDDIDGNALTMDYATSQNVLTFRVEGLEDFDGIEQTSFQLAICRPDGSTTMDLMTKKKTADGWEISYTTDWMGIPVGVYNVHITAFSQKGSWRSARDKDIAITINKSAVGALPEIAPISIVMDGRTFQVRSYSIIGNGIRFPRTTPRDDTSRLEWGTRETKYYPNAIIQIPVSQKSGRINFSEVFPIAVFPYESIWKATATQFKQVGINFVSHSSSSSVTDFYRMDLDILETYELGPNGDFVYTLSDDAKAGEYECLNFTVTSRNFEDFSYTVVFQFV